MAVAALAAMPVLLGIGCANRPPGDQVTRWLASPDAVQVRGASFPAYHLRRHGDLAAGTLANGGGDVILDRLYYYQCTPEGAIHPLQPTEPLAAGWAVRFQPDRIESLEPDDTSAKLDALLTVAVPDRAMPCAIRLIGRFASIRLASGHVLQRVSGMLFGVRLPADGGLARPDGGLSLYFLSSDWLTGGRVDDFTLIDGSLAIDLCPRYLLINPATAAALEQLRR